MGMNDVNSLSHTKWNCKYHIVFCAQIPQKSILSRKACSNRKDTAATMRMERCKDHRSRSVSGSYPSFPRDTAEVFRIELHGLPKREK